MVLLREYRIPLPISVEEYKVAQLYMVAKVSRNSTSHGEGVEIVENRPFNDGALSGQFTHKIFHLGSRLPTWMRSFAPSALQIEEKAWNAYPYCKTYYTCPLLGDRFSLSIETRYAPDSGTQSNCLGLSKEDLSIREIDIIDIARDPVDPLKYKVEEDPTIFQSQKTGRGKLEQNWMSTSSPIMCSYKVCKVEFRCWGIQSRVEQYIQKNAIRDILFMGHRQVFCWIDEWFGMDMNDIRKMEEQVKLELKQQLQQQQIQKNKSNSNNNNTTFNNNNITQGNDDDEQGESSQQSSSSSSTLLPPPIPPPPPPPPPPTIIRSTNNNTNNNNQTTVNNSSSPSSSPSTSPYFDNNLNEIVISLKRMMIVDINSFAVTFTLIVGLAVVGFINLASHSLLWMCAMVALFVTLFQVWFAIRENRLLLAPNNMTYPGNHHSIWGVNRYHNNSNHNNNNGNVHNGSFVQPLNNRFPHLINAPLNLQLTLIDRDFNSNDYEMLLALDQDNLNYGAAKKEEIESLPMHTIKSDNDIEHLFSDTQSSSQQPTSCSICLDEFEIDNHLKTLPCLHHFHSECIDKWLKIKANCPICKSSLT
ncbi:phosphatidylinositol transfer protein [Cavenderia fasciculata]|uniref:Phosphatidylinositol transfer protein n=1 Tax=Cavenderia fasciculata TaxID=261658 RepID=F4Q5J9_CACFS|nr:phosphatidylinositol transfer protein [Cavenderia fasciculata]EGG17258.1 phosphatidylinositol transfer protein [Cavenderia fasciculata]|eukprot:XP_004355742.1 phosphatidylinositol transfer protein [Cavenderia fasciculata]